MQAPSSVPAGRHESVRHLSARHAARDDRRTCAGRTSPASPLEPIRAMVRRAAAHEIAARFPSVAALRAEIVAMRRRAALPTAKSIVLSAARTRSTEPDDPVRRRRLSVNAPSRANDANGRAGSRPQPAPARRDAVRNDIEIARADIDLRGYVERGRHDERTGRDTHRAVIVRARVRDVTACAMHDAHERVIGRRLQFVAERLGLRESVELRSGDRVAGSPGAMREGAPKSSAPTRDRAPALRRACRSRRRGR